MSFRYEHPKKWKCEAHPAKCFKRKTGESNRKILTAKYFLKMSTNLSLIKSRHFHLIWNRNNGGRAVPYRLSNKKSIQINYLWLKQRKTKWIISNISLRIFIFEKSLTQKSFMITNLYCKPNYLPQIPLPVQ